ncbi:hypothetical protein [Corynebacterium sp.]|uniref:DUF6928 family protein n=1 Tax=Corynebacterium sp. TaxID=1720 RepID=UPI0026DC4EFF|nr:hypothetical protein [Corynebacterium sp.]MDO5032718.1 hypothetical protein [Corynebacterium sp.]
MDTKRSILTLWYVTADDPAAVLRAEPKADRGFGRKFLAQLNPSLPVTLIGQFPLNRSAPTGESEYYIGGYPGVTVVQTVVDDTQLVLSQLSPALLNAVPATELYAFSIDEDSGYAGFAHWTEGALRRSLCGTRFNLLEDQGLPEPFEAPFWAGEMDEPIGGISLPFEPRGITEAAQAYWLGVDVSAEGPDLDVVGYATDGRPEPKVDASPASTRSISELAGTSVSKLGLNDYDDYENYDQEPESTGEEILRTARRLGGLIAHYVAETSKSVVESTKSLRERWRS